ncbi:MAG: Asp-tRNA(Asn)/Glu-tRNA(Gln) amidotransferase subunit GatB [Firmicutes bacterium]|nr:Asp-tRNA(Asn)/Glu-tRNA(Gln) amidotransferase subunit GatB [Bacillota bacterium]
MMTETKLFCSCSTAFGAPPNTHVCPVCLGLPGVLPVLNRRAVELALMAALALHCEITPQERFDRKNYFYPDLPKAYQITQWDLPIGKNGYLEITTDEGIKRIGITRIHIEEDAGKLNHGVGGYSLVDYNRVGVPLIEIVSEPDLRSPREAQLYLEKLRSIMVYAGISDARMEEGSLRCDANISLRPLGSSVLGKRAEIKNVNSFRGVVRALEYEQQRQAEALQNGEVLHQETRRWDEDRGMTFSMRSKEEANDYRYFPEPDLVQLVIEDAMIAAAHAALPELPDAKQKRYIETFGLSAYDASVLTASKQTAAYFEAAVAAFPKDPKAVANWVMGDFSRKLNEAGLTADQAPLTPEQLAEIPALIDEGTLSSKMAKELFEKAWAKGASPRRIAQEEGMTQITDLSQLIDLARRVVAGNPKAVADVRAGKQKAMGALVGQMMKETKGRANPTLVHEALQQAIEEQTEG